MHIHVKLKFFLKFLIWTSVYEDAYFFGVKNKLFLNSLLQQFNYNCVLDNACQNGTS